VIFLSRKSHYVQTINHKDIDFLNALRCAGLCTKEQATKFISANRLKNFVLNKTIEKCTYISDTGHRQEIYRISEQGQKWIAKNIDTLADRCYYRSTGVEHDLKLMDKVLSLSREERLTMRCESEIREEFRERLQDYLFNREYDRYEQLYDAMKNHTISMPDLAYGIDEYYEVVTSSYGELEIQAKIAAVQAIGGNLEMERI